MSDHHYFGPARYASPRDSLDFTRFRQGLTIESSGIDTSLTYRLIWREDQHGGSWTVSREDGSATLAPTEAMIINGFQLHTSFRTAEGQRGVLVSFDRPCAMICRSARYYVQE